jgi:hypothetical protein
MDQQVTQAGEMLILTFGIQLAYASRNSPIKGVSKSWQNLIKQL